jgi:hypothetical protein
MSEEETRTFRESKTNNKREERSKLDQTTADLNRDKDRNHKLNIRVTKMLSEKKYFNDKFKDDETEMHYCGAMDIECQDCHALHFPSEKPTDGKFMSCCHKGKVILPERRNFPEYLKDIMSNQDHPDHKNFKENIRNYNSSLSFASMGAKTDELPGKGPYCFRVCGQIYHCTSNVHPNENESRQYAQLYVVDSSQANIHRQESRANVKCVSEIIANLDKIMRENNVSAKTYQMLGEIEKNKDWEQMTFLMLI